MADHALSRRRLAGEMSSTGPHSPRPFQPAVDPELRGLLGQARNRAGLCVLMLLKRDPTACETAEGFHLRLRYPLEELAESLESLAAAGVLGMSRQQSDATYWLPADSPHLPALHRLASIYHAGPAGRNCLVAHLPWVRA